MKHGTKSGAGGDISEAELRAIYRGLAVESTPPVLDASVLNAAREHLRHRHYRARRWYRPLAVAATVALCVALVLDLSVEPEAPVAQSPEPETTMRENVHDAARESRAQKMGEGKAEKAELAAASADMPATPGADRTEPGLVTGAASGADAKLRESSPESVAEAPAAHSFAEGAADARAPIRARAGTATTRQTEGCSSDVTDDPESWLDCIAELENGGRSELAQWERERFESAYPAQLHGEH